MAEHLSPLDAMFLELEQADDSAHMHIGAVLVFDPLPGGGTPTVADLGRRLSERLPVLPRYRQRLSSVRTGGLTWPTWEEDPHFEIEDHVRHAVLPAPGGEAELVEWAADFWSHRLDRSRALWEVVLLDGLAGGRWALVTKTHHCLVDGVASVGVTDVLMDPPRAPARGPGAAPPAPPAPAADGWSPQALLLRGARAGLSATAHPRTVLAKTRAALEM
jgi:diacylglycerol O-acyltransferase / wax synthase